MAWKQKNQTLAYYSEHVVLYEDTVETEEGLVIPHYSTIKLPDIVMVVATNPQDELIVIDEYKYAIRQSITTLPAGRINNDESPASAAKRELLEETGYVSDNWEFVDFIHEYPSKLSHTITIMRARFAIKTKEPFLETTEKSILTRLIPIHQIKTETRKQSWRSASVLAALYLCF